MAFTPPGIDWNGTQWADSYTASAGNDTLRALEGDDVIRGAGGNDSIEGGDGNDQLLGGEGSDILLGGEGNDLLTDAADVWDTGSTYADGGNGDDTLHVQGQGNQTLLGGAGNDRLSGYGANMVLDGGTGNDTLEANALNGTVTGGDGVDLFIVGNGDIYSVAITDFVAGVGGDVLSFQDYFLSKGAFDGLNPFSVGQLQLIQDGANTVFQYDKDGAEGSSSPYILATLQNVVATDLRTENFTLGVDPWAPAPPKDILWTGTADGEEYTGTWGDDTLNALGGNDVIYGKGGDDSIDGGVGDDSLIGGFGDDTLLGGDGNDSIQGGDLAGDDGDTYADGGDGNDTIHVSMSSNFATGNHTVLGGSGNDRISGFGLSMEIDGGSGDDTLQAGSLNGVVTGGEGKDLFIVGDGDIYSVVITDFVAGVDGDVLDPRVTIPSGGPLAGLNPFTAGQFQLVQDGANTIFRFDEDGPDGSKSPYILATLQNVVAADLRTENFTLGIDPWEPLPPTDILWTGTEAGEVYTGTRGKDTLQGLGGNDRIEGVGGDDSIEGGEGDDTLYGGFGSDTLLGGTGNDSLYETGNKDVGDTYADGGEGNDTFQIYSHGNHTLIGGEGNDYLYGSGPNVVLEGGLGNDTLKTDAFSVYAWAGGAVVTEADAIHVAASGGEGKDVFFTSELTHLVISDFEAGDGGDRMGFTEGSSRISTGRFQGVDPFVSGQFQWTQDGANTLFQVDLEVDGVVDVEVVLENVDASAITAQNFYSAAGTATNDYLEGTSGNDNLDGLWGNDTVIGADGDDRLGGAMGDDLVTGGNGNDTLAGGSGRDTLIGGEGDDLFIVSHSNVGISDTSFPDDIDRVLSSVDWKLDSFLEDLVLDGNASIDGVGNQQANEITGNSGKNFLDGQGGVDLLTGGRGADQLVGGLGRDTLIGGAGSDRLTGAGKNDGSGEIERLTGGAQGDIFTLGDKSGQYYEDKGKGDYAYIADFTIGSDRLMLRGKAEQYSLGEVNISKGSGVGLFFSHGDRDELIAVIHSSNGKDLTVENTIETARFV